MKNNISLGVRKIARLDLKNDKLIKGIYMEGYKVLGDPIDYAVKYYEQGIDELVIIDNVASLFNTKLSLGTIKDISKNVFIPITVGGGIKNISDVDKCFEAGVDRVSINSSLFHDLSLINQVAKKYGSQAIQASIHSKVITKNTWHAFYQAGREKTGKCVVEYVKELESLGAGEILVTSVNNDGTLEGMDIQLMESLANKVSIPLLIGGGYASKADYKMVDYYNFSGIVIASALHYNKCSISNIGK